MTKILLVLIISVLFFLPLISAVEFTMNDNFKQGETILAKVSGNFLTQIAKDNIFFYRGHVKIPMEYDVANIGGDFYIYVMTIGKNPENDYSISIENVKYMKGAEITDDNIVKNFSITNETADFSVKPGFVVTSEDFSLEIQNLLESSITIDVKTETTSEGREISTEGKKETSIALKSGEIKQIIFNLGAGEPTLQNIELSTIQETTEITTTPSENNSSSGFCFFWENCTTSSNETQTTTTTTTKGIKYEIPVYISTGADGTQEEFFKFEPSEIDLSIPLNTKLKRTIYLYNTGDNNLENISITLPESFSPFVNLSTTKIENLSAKTNIPIELTFFSSNESELEGNLKAKIGDTITYSFISLKFLKNYTSNETDISTKTCAELGGVVCNTADEKCSETPIYAKDNVCCLGNCEKIEKGNSGTIIAIILAAVIILFLLWFYFTKYKRAKKPVDLLKISKGKKY